MLLRLSNPNNILNRGKLVKCWEEIDMITLIDTFNNVIISKHRNRNNAIKAMHKHLESVKKANGKDSYLTYEIRDLSGKTILFSWGRKECLTILKV